MRSSEQIEAHAEESSQPTEQRPKHRRGNPDKIKPFMWKPGQSGNPGGRPRRDFASELCRAVIEDNPDLVYKGILKTLRKGSAFGLQVVADRGYGKLKEQVELNVSGSLSERLEKARKRKAGK